MTHAELYASWRDAKDAADEAVKRSGEACRTAYELELRLYEVEGRTQLPRAVWIQARLAGNLNEADKIITGVPASEWCMAAVHPFPADAQRHAENARSVRVMAGLSPLRGLKPAEDEKRESERGTP
jgi:hypothetical protein